MYIFLVFFSVSLMLMIAMVGYRLLEFKIGKIQMPHGEEPIISLEKIAARMPWIKQEEIMRIYNQVYRYGRKAVLQALTAIKNNSVSNRIQKTIDSMNGKNGIVKRESKSQFFKAIAEYKKKIKDEQL